MDQMNTAAASTSVIALPPPTRNVVWSDGPAKKQNFSIPEKILYFMARNPKSPEFYLKLAMSCKYFSEQMPLLVAKRIVINDDEKKLCSSDDEENCDEKNHKCCVDVDLAKITSTKIWLTGKLDIHGNNVISNLAEMLLPKLYRCDIAELSLQHRKVTWNEFQSLAKVFCKFHLVVLDIKYDDGKPVMLDAILNAIPDVKQFLYVFDYETPTATTSTMKKILKLQNFGNLRNFSLFCIPKNITLEDLKVFMKKYKDKKFYLDFHRDMSDEYKRQLDGYINEIIASNFPNRVISYPGQDEEKLYTMYCHYVFLQ